MPVGISDYGYEVCGQLLAGAHYVVVINNPDGSASFFYDSSNGDGTWEPFQMGSQCCNVWLNTRVAQGSIEGGSGHTYTWNEDRQICGWVKFPENCDEITSFNVLLNPQGNYGALFYADTNETCYLEVKFDYLFQFDCQQILDIQEASQNDELIELYNHLESQGVICDSLQSQLETYESIPFNHVLVRVHEGNTIPPIYYVLTEIGIEAWHTILDNYFNINHIDSLSWDAWLSGEFDPYNIPQSLLGPFLYLAFISGNPDLYYTICDNINGECDALIQSNLVRQSNINDITIQLNDCQADITATQSSIDAILALQAGHCVLAIDTLERLDASMSIDIQDPNTPQVVNSVYTEHIFGVGANNLFTYLMNNSPSGIYITNYSGVTCDGSTCDALAGLLTQQLIDEANALRLLTGTTALEQINEVNTLIGHNPFSSDWLHFETIINDPLVISAITNQYINLSIKINDSCVDFCILIDKISLNKICNRVTTNEIFVTSNPSFDIQKVIDNKKSWIANEEPIHREFNLESRNTSYNENHFKLVVNTKEIDLDVSIPNAIETDVWCYIDDNPCLLSACSTTIGIDYGTCSSGTTITGTNFTGGTEILPTPSQPSGTTNCSNIDYLMGWAVSGAPNIFSSETTNCSFIYKINSAYGTSNSFIGNWLVGETDGSIGLYDLVTISGGSSTITNVTNDLTQECCNAIGNNISQYNNVFGTNYRTFSWDTGRTQCIITPIEVELPIANCCCEDEVLSGTNITGGTVVLGGEYSTGNTITNNPSGGMYALSLLSASVTNTSLIEENVNCSFIYKLNNLFSTLGNPAIFDGIWITGENDGTIGLYYNYTMSGGSATTENYSNVMNATMCNNLAHTLQVYEGTINTPGSFPIFPFTYGNLGDHFVKPYWDDECQKCKYVRCGDRCIDLDGLLTSSVSGITTMSEFNDIISSELINARCRKTISAYPTLRLLYDRYMNNSLCSTQSAQFDYDSMSNFSSLIGTYWVDLIEQVIPSTTIWGANYIYGNTIYDAQKYKYKGYSLFTCVPPQNYPLGIIGSNNLVDVDEAVLTFSSQCETYVQCSGVYIIQRDCGSEFIGSVNVIPSILSPQQSQQQLPQGGGGITVIIENE